MSKYSPFWFGLVDQVCKAARTKDEIRITPSGASVRLSTGPVTIDGSLSTSVFPPYEQVMPKDADTASTTVGLHCEYLADVLLVQKAAERHGVTMRVGMSDMDPVKLTTQHRDGTEWTVVIMPLRP